MKPSAGRRNDACYRCQVRTVHHLGGWNGVRLPADTGSRQPSRVAFHRGLEPPELPGPLLSRSSARTDPVHGPQDALPLSSVRLADWIVGSGSDRPGRFRTFGDSGDDPMAAPGRGPARVSRGDAIARRATSSGRAPASTSSSVRTPSCEPLRKSTPVATRRRSLCVTLWLRGTKS